MQECLKTEIYYSYICRKKLSDRVLGCSVFVPLVHCNHNNRNIHISTMFQFFREIDKSKKWIQPRPWSLAVRLLVWAHGWVCDGPLLVVSGQSHGDTSGEPSYDAPLWIGHNLHIPTAEVRWQHWVCVDMCRYVDSRLRPLNLRKLTLTVPDAAPVHTCNNYTDIYMKYLASSYLSTEVTFIFTICRVDTR